MSKAINIYVLQAEKGIFTGVGAMNDLRFVDPSACDTCVIFPSREKAEAAAQNLAENFGLNFPTNVVLLSNTGDLT